ncbi:FUSC family protein [Microbulbifer sp. SSSA008]|uniref:FUSC family protein n=1 Tax=Microbulbifer sp. SSSA008 TaxID=3243380 RepID=UPI0040395622
MQLSRNVKESIKLATALVIVYAIALGLNWEKPFWGGFAVIVCSQANLGQSLNRAILWILGTLFALLAGWLIVALFPQDRWLFMIALSIWVSICVYFLQRSNYQYFWLTSGYVIFLLWDVTGGDFSISYKAGVLRIQESLLGIIVYGLVAVLIWPNCSRGELRRASLDLLREHRRFVDNCFSRVRSGEKIKIRRKKRVALLELDTRLQTAIGDASSDSYEVWECRKQWGHFGQSATAVTQSLLKLEESLALSGDLGISKFLIGVDEYMPDIEGRLAQVETALSEEMPVDSANGRVVRGNIEEVKRLSTFETAALAVTRKSLNDLEVETRSLIDSVNDIQTRGDSYSRQVSSDGIGWLGALMPDPDRLTNIVRVQMGMWIAYLAYLFIPDMIGGLLVILLITVIGILASMTPKIQLFETCVFTILVCILSAPIYFFLMPKLHGFYSLAVVIFVWTFVVSFSSNKVFGPQSMIRTLVLIFPQIIFNFNNSQEYSFVVYTNYLFVLAIIFCILAVSRNIPFTAHPEINLKRSIDRVLNSAAWLVVEGDIPKKKRKSLFFRLYILYHLNIIMISRKRVFYWVEGISDKKMRGMTRSQMQSLIGLAMLISNQVKLLYKIDKKKINFVAPKRLLREAFIWRRLASKILIYFSGGNQKVDIESLRRGYRRIFERANIDVGELMELRECSEKSREGVTNFLYFLGVTHCINNYLVEFRRVSETVDWKAFCEERCL